MSDDLVKRLWQLDMHPESAPRQAADRIEALEVERDAASAALKRLGASCDYLSGRAEKAERGAAVTVGQAAKVLLDASGDWWPSQEAKQAAISAYTLKNGKCRPVALTDAWHAALNALKETDT